jgi:hypothetical protein
MLKLRFVCDTFQQDAAWRKQSFRDRCIPKCNLGTREDGSEVEGRSWRSSLACQDDSAQASQVTVAGLAPSNPKESAIAATLPPGPYTTILAGLNDGTGVGLVEVYDRGGP